MQLRTIKQFIIHLQTFRNIELWYQGIYYLKFTLYIQNDKNPKEKVLYAQPFAVTECNLIRKDSQNQLYDSQLVSPSFINVKQSAYYSKSFHLKYFQEEVQINDICHFRAEVDTFNQKNTQFILQVGLWFYDSFKKEGKHTKNFKDQSKQVRNIKFVISPFINSQCIHEYIPVLFQDHYFSLNNLVIHGFNVDQRVRMNPLQLSQFANLSDLQKKSLIQKIKNEKYSKSASLTQYLKQQLRCQKDGQVMQAFVGLLKEHMKINQLLIQEYKKIFDYSITQNQIKYFSDHIIHPTQILKFASIDYDKQFKQGSQLILSNQSSQNVDLLEDKIVDILNKVNYVGAKNINVWSMFIKLLKINPRFSVAFYQKKYRQHQSSFWEKLIKLDQINSTDITSSYNKRTQSLIKQLQKNKNQISFNKKVYQHKLIEKKASLPTLIIQSFSSQNQKMRGKVSDIKDKMNKMDKQCELQGIHLVILVHGFQGSSYDMKLIKNNISFLFPQSMFLCCTANQDLTDNDIFQMGNRLALQIKSYILQNFPKNTLGRISFIGHSLGGLKIRAALPKLLQFKDKFYCFISFSSPHLGYKINTSSVIQAGIWILQKMKQSECLKQLTMTDHTDPYQTTLFRLSLQQGLQYFKKIYLYSSIQDSYAPYESARIQIDPAFMGSNDPLKSVHCQMVKNILKNIKSQVIHRVNVNFTINTKNIDSFIGRTAHIMFLQTGDLIKCIAFTNPKLFS